jgi:hypothetical protein
MVAGNAILADITTFTHKHSVGRILENLDFNYKKLQIKKICNIFERHSFLIELRVRESAIFSNP